MPYTALPDMRIPYDNDGTVIGYRSNTQTQGWQEGLEGYLSQSQGIEMNDEDYTAVLATQARTHKLWWFFPEQREITAMAVQRVASPGSFGGDVPIVMSGSNDTTNGVDGTWETPSFPSGLPQPNNTTYFDYWRTTIKPISFTGGKRTLRGYWGSSGLDFQGDVQTNLVHLYGEKVAGQTPDDVIYIDHDTTPGIEYTAPEDFGDQPLGTTVVRQFRLKNTSATKTANSINVQCNDSDFAISTDGVTWVVTINIASLGPGAQSATMYVRCTTPAPGNLLGPRFARIVTTVASYT